MTLWRQPGVLVGLRWQRHTHHLRTSPSGAQAARGHFSTHSSEATAMDAKTDRLKEGARRIFAAGVDAVLPPRLVSQALRYRDNCLTVGGREYKVDHNVYIVGFGKAVIGMVGVLEAVLKEHVRCGVVSVPFGIQAALREAGRSDLLPVQESRVTIIEGAKNNLPDVDSLRAAQEIEALTRRLGKDDLLAVLVSGGGSALLPSPIPPLTLQDMHAVSQTLGCKGCSINELNTVRKHLSLLKGGGLAKLAYPAQVISFILSDVVGNHLDMIASGPTILDDSTPQDCLDIISRRGAGQAIPRSVLDFLRGQAAAGATVASGAAAAGAAAAGKAGHVLNVCIGNNGMAAQAARRRAEELGFQTALVSVELTGESDTVAEAFVELASYVCQRYQAGRPGSTRSESDPQVLGCAAALGLSSASLEGIRAAVDQAVDQGSSMCLVGAGETTVAVRGTGKGGRNQQMALAAATAMAGRPVFEQLLRAGFGVVFLSGGTDGQDGPTNAAGALADPWQVVAAAGQCGLDAHAFLRNNDSYSFYSQLNAGKDHLKTGLTGTNVMDIQVLLIEPPH